MAIRSLDLKSWNTGKLGALAFEHQALMWWVQNSPTRFRRGGCLRSLKTPFGPGPVKNRWKRMTIGNAVVGT